MLAFKTFVSLALPLLAVANPLVVRTDTLTCNSGSLNCCQTTQSASSTSSLLGLLGLGGLQGLLGFDCSPLTALGVGSTQCSQQTVCCTGNSYSGLVVVGCSPMNLGL